MTFLANYLPLQDSYGGPNDFDLKDRALYQIHVDQNGDAVEDLTFSADPVVAPSNSAPLNDGVAVDAEDFPAAFPSREPEQSVRSRPGEVPPIRHPPSSPGSGPCGGGI